MDPIPPRGRRDVRPQGLRLRSGRESLSQSGRHDGFRFLLRRRDLQRDNVVRLCARSFAQFDVPGAATAVSGLGLLMFAISGTATYGWTSDDGHRLGVMTEVAKHDGLSVAMGNAKPEVKAVAQRTIGRNDEDGLATFLEELVAQHTVVPAPQ